MRFALHDHAKRIANEDGIDAGIAGQIFRPFVSTKERGTGLGLSIVKRIIDQHGGAIELTPRPGGGTIASITLQLVREAETREP